MPTPATQLRTLFALSDRQRILGTLEPNASQGPLFALIRGRSSCAFAARNDLPTDLADELEALARTEPPLGDFREPPVHAERYLDVLSAWLAASSNAPNKRLESDGPAFVFTTPPEPRAGVTLVEDEALLTAHFPGWKPGDLAGGRRPVFGVLEHGVPVSICFSARSASDAAEAGVETAPTHRGRGLGERVVAAWARAIWESGRAPLYSTWWGNLASLAIARKLGVSMYASDWSLYDEPAGE